MSQQLKFKNEELEQVANNADALFAWIEEELPVTEKTERPIRIPSHLVLVTATFVASSLPLLVGPESPGVICWYGGCSGG